MVFKFLFITASLWLSLALGSVCPKSNKACNNKEYLKISNKMWPQQGPNCFAVAMWGTGHRDNLIGVDTLEFEHFLNKFCQKTKNPRSGSIGVYSRQSFLTHAFLRVDEMTVLQKLGVDYFSDPSSAALISFEAMNYTFSAGKYCRQYSRDISTCSNTLTYYDCKSKGPTGDVAYDQLSTETQKLRRQVSLLVEQEYISNENQNYLKALSLLPKLRVKVLTRKNQLNTGDFHYLQSQLLSIKKQLRFLHIKH